MPDGDGAPVRFSVAHGIDGAEAVRMMREQQVGTAPAFEEASDKAAAARQPPPLISRAPTRSLTENSGRPPSPWRVSGAVVVDRLNDLDDPASLAEVARMAGVNPRTVVRVLRRCGYVMARATRDECYAEWLPMTRVHHVDELAALRRHLNAHHDQSISASAFASLCGIVRSVMTSSYEEGVPPVWVAMDRVDYLVSQDRDYTDEIERLPGDHGSKWGVKGDRRDNKTTASPLARSDRSKGGRRHMVTPVDTHRSQVIRSYELGETVEYLAKVYGVAPATVHRRLRSWGVQLRERGPRGGGSNTGTGLSFDEGDRP